MCNGFGWRVNEENDRCHTAGCASGVSIPLRAGVLTVIPAEAGIQGSQERLDPGFRRGDDHACGVTDGVFFKSTKLTPQLLSPRM